LLLFAQAIFFRELAHDQPETHEGQPPLFEAATMLRAPLWQVVCCFVLGCGSSDALGLRHGDGVYLTTPRRNHRITAQEDGRVHASWNHRGSWQRFVLERADGAGEVVSGDVVLLRAWTGKRLTLQDMEVHAKWDHEGGWQKFVIEAKGAAAGAPVTPYSTIFLKGHTGRRVDADAPDSLGVVQARWSHMGSWQELIIEAPRCPGLTAENLASRLTVSKVYLPVRFTWECQYGRQPWTCRHGHYAASPDSEVQAYLYSDIDRITHLLLLNGAAEIIQSKALGHGKAVGLQFEPGAGHLVAAVSVGTGTDSLIDNPPTFMRFEVPSLEVVWTKQAERHADVHTSWATPDNAHGLAVSKDRLVWHSAGSCTGECTDGAGETLNVLDLATGEEISAEGHALPGVRSAKQMVGYNRRSGAFVTASAAASAPSSLRFQGYADGKALDGPSWESWGWGGARQGVTLGALKADPESGGFAGVWSHGVDKGTPDKLYFSRLQVSADNVAWSMEPKAIFPDSNKTEVGGNVVPLGKGRWLLAYTESDHDFIEAENYLFSSWERWNFDDSIRTRGGRMAIIDSAGRVQGAPVNISAAGAYFPVEMNHLVERPDGLSWAFIDRYGIRMIRIAHLRCDRDSE